MLTISGVVERVQQLPPRQAGEAPLTAVSIEGILYLATPGTPLPAVGAVTTAYARATQKREGKGQTLWYVGPVA